MLSDANKHAASLLGQSKMCPAIRAKQSADNGKRCSINGAFSRQGSSGWNAESKRNQAQTGKHMITHLKTSIQQRKLWAERGDRVQSAGEMLAVHQKYSGYIKNSRI